MRHSTAKLQLKASNGSSGGLFATAGSGRGLWERVVPVYITLFGICKPLGPQHRVLRKATAILLDVFQSIKSALKLQKEGLCDDDDGVLEKQKKELLQELKGSELINNFAKLYGVQKRLLSSGTIWDELGTTAGIMTNDSNH